MASQILDNDIADGLIVEHISDGATFYVTQLEPTSETVDISGAKGAESKTISTALLKRSYRKLAKHGLKAQFFLDPDIVFRWATDAPLNLINAVLNDRERSSAATENDFKQKLERVIGNIKWRDWWTGVNQIANENQGATRILGGKWYLRDSNSSPSQEIPLPAPVVTRKPRVSSKRPVQKLSDIATSVISGNAFLKDLNDTERQNVTRRLLDDGIWWWFWKPEGISQVIRYDRSLTELLNHLSRPDLPAEHLGLQSEMISRLSSSGNSRKLEKVLASIKTSFCGDDGGDLGNARSAGDLIPVLLQTSLKIRNEENRDANDAAVVEATIGDLLTQWPSVADVVTSFFERYSNLTAEMKEAVHKGTFDLAIPETDATTQLSRAETEGILKSGQSDNRVISNVVSSVMSALSPEVRIELTLKMVVCEETRPGVLEYLARTENTKDNLAFLLTCIRRAALFPESESLQGISAVADEFFQDLDQRYSEQMVALWMAITGTGLQVTGSLARNMAALIKQQITPSEGRENHSINQVLDVFGMEFKKEFRRFEQRAQRELIGAQELQKKSERQVEILESELESEKRLVERIRTGHRLPEQLAEFYGKTAVLEPIAQYLQQLILQESGPAGETSAASTTALRLLDLLSIAGVRKMQEVGDHPDYKPTLHEYTADTSVFDPPITVVCPGFVIDDPDGKEVILKRAIVRSADR